MNRRAFVIPARYLPALDAALDQVMDRIEKDLIPEFAQDDVPDTVFIQVTLERTYNATKRSA